MVKSRVLLGMGDLPPFNRNPSNGYINPYYWVDEFIPYYMDISWELIDPIAHIPTNKQGPFRHCTSVLDSKLDSISLGSMVVSGSPYQGGIGSIVHPPIGSIYHLYTTYILPSRGLYNPYHPLQEPEKSTDRIIVFPATTLRKITLPGTNSKSP